MHASSAKFTHREGYKKGCRTVNPAAAFHFGVSDKIIKNL